MCRHIRPGLRASISQAKYAARCFDYTKWQQEYYDAIPEKKLQEAIDKHSEKHPF